MEKRPIDLFVRKLYMSQSDYISKKKTGVLLGSVQDFNPVLPSQIYTTLKGYTIERKIIDHCLPKIMYNRLTLPNKVLFRNVECTTPFSTCEGDLLTYLEVRKTGSQQNGEITKRNPFNEYNLKLKQLSYESPDTEIIQKYTEKEFCQCDVYFSNRLEKKH